MRKFPERTTNGAAATGSTTATAPIQKVERRILFVPIRNQGMIHRDAKPAATKREIALAHAARVIEDGS